VLYRSLHWQNISGSTLGSINTTESSEVLESDTFASEWLSVSVLDNVTALYINSATQKIVQQSVSSAYSGPRLQSLHYSSAAALFLLVTTGMCI
jgi:hypothetical protein